MLSPCIPLLDSEPLNTKRGFELIHSIMKQGNVSFHKALQVIFTTREVNISTARNIITMIDARYTKERRDVVIEMCNQIRRNNE